MGEIDGEEVAVDAGAFFLMRLFIGSRLQIPIDAEAAARLKAAMDDLHELVDVEQKFDIVMENFLELETEMTTRLLKQAYRSDHSSQEFYADKLAFNRRILNVLTATRLYVDQAMHHIGVFFPKDAEKKAELKALFSHEYDSVPAYRVMDALRNFAQHRGLPLQGMTYKSSWIDMDDEEAYLQHNVALNLILADLDGEGGLKKSVLKELQAQGGKIDVKKMVREYVEALARVHVAFRQILEPRIAAAEALIAETMEQYCNACDDEHGATGLAVGQKQANGSFKSFVAIHNEPLDSIKILRSRTSSLIKLSKRTVTSEAIKPKAR